MAKTYVTISDLESIPQEGAPLLATAETVKAIAEGKKELGTLKLIEERVRDLQEFADKLKDLGDKISKAIKTAELEYARVNGEPTAWFGIKRGGFRIEVTDYAKLLETAENLAYNVDFIRKFEKVTVDYKDAMKAMGIDRDRFKDEFADCLKVTAISDSLTRKS